MKITLRRLSKRRENYENMKKKFKKMVKKSISYLETRLYCPTLLVYIHLSSNVVHISTCILSTLRFHMYHYPFERVYANICNTMHIQYEPKDMRFHVDLLRESESAANPFGTHWH